MSAASSDRLQVDKLEVAVRQLNTAIRLWFHEDDPFSAHTLAYAAYTVIDDVTKARIPNRPGLLFDAEQLTAKDRMLFNRVYKHPANFNKHADRDPNGKISFSSDQTRVLLCFAIYGLSLVAERMSTEIFTFETWMNITRPDLIGKEASEVFNEGFLVKYAEVSTMPKREFFDHFTNAVSNIIAAQRTAAATSRA